MGFCLQALVDKRFKNHWTTLVHFTGKQMEATRLAQGRQVSVLGMWLPRKPVGRWLRWDLGTGQSLACFLCSGPGLPEWTRGRTHRFWQGP